MTHLDDIEKYQDLLDTAWNRELALFFQEILYDLEAGHINEEQAIERIKQICPSSSP